MSEIRGLSLTQPWATLMAVGAKRIETRSWLTSYRGLVAIHASKGFPKEARQVCHDEPFRSVLVKAGLLTGGYEVVQATKTTTIYEHRTHLHLSLGAIVAVGELVGCYLASYQLPDAYKDLLTDQEMAFGDYSPGRWAWVLQNIRKLPEPIPCTGHLGLWTVPPEIAAQLAAFR